MDDWLGVTQAVHKQPSPSNNDDKILEIYVDLTLTRPRAFGLTPLPVLCASELPRSTYGEAADDLPPR